MTDKNEIHHPTKEQPGWIFINDDGAFELRNAAQTNALYFPLVNHSGMKSAIAPDLNGDAKRDQNTFLLLPVSVEDLHNTRSARNFWIKVNEIPWSVSGNSAPQISKRFSSQEEKDILRAGFLWHSTIREHEEAGVTAEVINFVPSGKDSVELMQVKITNNGQQSLKIEPTAAIPIYGRSADNLRDHRHVTALLHRTTCHPHGVLVKPTMSFDERGHQTNHTTYAVLGMDADGNPPKGFCPLVEDFIGEGGCLEWPAAVVQNQPNNEKAGCEYTGFESIGGLFFESLHLAPGESKSYILILAILEKEQSVESLIERYGSEKKFNTILASTKKFWKNHIANLQFNHHAKQRDGWLKWVTLQPTLRQIMGNSFLPYHDYGRGGRGWRDLWQDLLAIMITSPQKVDQLLMSHFAGIRMDGSNATIIGESPGEFKADRNDIPRVWMDHGAWPLFTTRFYIDWTGDLNLLLEEQTYFSDHLSHRCQVVNPEKQTQDDTRMKSISGDLIKGTILEHLLIQNLTEFFNIGEHNLMRLEGGDWNDGLDMAAERGESVAFSAMYAGNLRILSDLCQALITKGLSTVTISEELSLLLDRMFEPVDYESIADKRARLQKYFDRVAGNLSGNKINLSLGAIADDLKHKAFWLTHKIQTQEWIEDQNGRGWFNGYYDNEGERVEGIHPFGVRMTLTGQVFPLMAGIATHQQAAQVVKSANEYLYDSTLHGYRLNNDFGHRPPKLGRAFGFAFGHKENGAVFSHMAVMFAYALYKQGLAQAAWHVLDGLYTQCINFSVSRIYPGIPEYFDPRGRGMYPYLTGSAAWYLLTYLTEAFGVKGKLGDLYLEPKLVSEQFSDTDTLSVKTIFAGKHIEVTYHNPETLSYGQYGIKSIIINGINRENPANNSFIQIERDLIKSLDSDVAIQIQLSKRK